MTYRITFQINRGIKLKGLNNDRQLNTGCLHKCEFKQSQNSYQITEAAIIIWYVS